MADKEEGRKGKMRFREMCKKAEEVQREWTPEVGDRVWVVQGDWIGRVRKVEAGMCVLTEGLSYSLDSLVWLP